MSEWKQVKLEDFVELITDYVANGSFASLKANVQIYKEPNYALMVKTADFANDFTKSLTYTDRRGYDYLSKSNLFGGELLLSNIGSVGKVFRVPYFDRPMTLASNSIMIRCKEELYYKWLYYFFLSPIGNQMLNGITTGTTMKKFNKTGLRGLIISVPGDDEKKRIVTRIEELFSELDNGVETLRKTKQELAVYRQAVLKQAFSKVDQYVPLGMISVSRLGKMLDKEKNIGVPRKYLRNINVRWFSFDKSDLLEMRIEDNEVDKYSIVRGDLVICEGGEPGRCAVWDSEESMFYQKALHRVRFTDGSNPKFYMYYLWFAAQTGKLNEYFTGMGIKHLTGQSLVKVPVPTLDRNGQDKIILEIESRLSMCDSIERTVDTALQQAEAMRQSILKQAFEGKL